MTVLNSNMDLVEFITVLLRYRVFRDCLRKHLHIGIQRSIKNLAFLDSIESLLGDRNVESVD